MTLSCCLVASAPAPVALDAIARACSPRVEPHGDRAVIFDAAGLARAVGAPPAIAAAVLQLAVTHGLEAARVALAGTPVAAWLLAQARPGVTVVHAGEDASALAPLPLECLATLHAPGARLLPEPDDDAPDRLAILRRWGLCTLGDFARLSRADVRARLGLAGVRWHQAANGEPIAPLVPEAPAARFVDRLDLEWPIDGLEPLSFVLARLCESLSALLERADRGAVEIALRLGLVSRETHERVLNLPAPMRDARVLRTLLLLDLESHGPPAAIDWVEIEAGVAPGAILQASLLSRALPSPEDMATLLARLRALVGESRVGAPALVDSHDDRVVALTAFVVNDSAASSRQRRTSPSIDRMPADSPPGPRTMLRRFRLPLAARVETDRGAPVRVDPAARGLPGGRVLACAGPWRSSGRWWALDGTDWNRDAWDVELADGSVYRIARDRTTRHWVVEAVID